jgi:hypothetical protein
MDIRLDRSVRLVLSMPTFLRVRGQRVYSMVEVPLVADHVVEPVPDNLPSFAPESTAYLQDLRFEVSEQEWVQRAVWDSLFLVAPQWDRNQSYVLLSLSLLRQLRALVEGVQGDPSRMPGGYGRMLYLSAITITTVGFGDVVPTTTWSRFLVGLEAVFGIVVAGLFVNAAMTRSSGGRPG